MNNMNTKIVHVPTLGKFSVFENDMISDKLSKGEIWEPWLQEIFKECVKNDKDVIDIGAYIGAHTVRLAQLAYPSIVYAFEPIYYEKLIENIKLNRLPNVVVEPFGLADKEKTANVSWIWTTETYTENRGNNYGCTGLDISPMGKPNWLKPLENPIPVNLKSLDSYRLKNVGFIKMDVEGLEREVIRGARETIRRCRPVITLECWKNNNGAIEDLEAKNTSLQDLRDLGYEVHHIQSSDFAAFPLKMGTYKDVYP